MLELSSEIAENNKGLFTQDNRNLKPEMYVCMGTLSSEMIYSMNWGSSLIYLSAKSNNIIASEHHTH